MAVAPFVGLKGSSWVTTACLDAGAMWPAQRGAPIVIECDPGGGDIAALYDLEVMPGIVSLAAELERGGVDPGRADELIAAHAQHLPGGLRVVVAPTSPEEVRLPLERLAQDLPLLAQGERRSHRRLRPAGVGEHARAHRHPAADPAFRPRGGGRAPRALRAPAAQRLASDPHRARGRGPRPPRRSRAVRRPGDRPDARGRGDRPAAARPCAEPRSSPVGAGHARAGSRSSGRCERRARR